jgi:hypothetical protein
MERFPGTSALAPRSAMTTLISTLNSAGSSIRGNSSLAIGGSAVEAVPAKPVAMRGELAKGVEDDQVGEGRGHALLTYRSAPASQGGEAPDAISARAPRVPFRRRATDPAGCRAGSGKRRAAPAAVGRRRERDPPISGAAGAKIGACSLAWHHGGSRKVAFSLNARGRSLSRSGHRCPRRPLRSLPAFSRRLPRNKSGPASVILARRRAPLTSWCNAKWLVHAATPQSSPSRELRQNHSDF